MLKTLDEIKDVEVKAGVVVNGVDNPNAMSIDSTEVHETVADELDEQDENSMGEVLDTVKPKEKKDEAKEVEDEEVEDEPEKTDEEEEEEKEKPDDKKDDVLENSSKKVVKRIGELTKKWRTAERERDYEREKRLEAEKKIKELSSKFEAEDSRPLKEDFDDEDDYLEALTDWKIDMRLKASQKEVSEEIADKEERKSVAQTYDGLDDAIERGRDKYDDFSSLVVDNEDLVLSPTVLQIALDSEVPEDVIYYLGSNPDESARISDLDPVRIAKEVGKIEGLLVSAKEALEKEEEEEVKPKPKPRKKQSSAPEPISPVRTTGAVEKDPNKMSPKEYRAWREKMSK